MVLGIFFRFANLDHKVYWFDEAITSMRVAGYKASEVAPELFNSRIVSIEGLRKYLRPNPQKGLSGTIRSLAIEDSQHPPLYYLMLRFWIQWFGSSAAVIKSFSALISLLVFPCIYWLCFELFGSSLVGWVAIALIALSPFHVLYAQNAREFCLWTVTILLSSAALLRAIRLNTKLSWTTYAATVALGLYSFLFFGFVAIGHGVYVAVSEGFRLSKTGTRYLLASFVGVLAFIPWIVAVISNLSEIRETTSWSEQDVGLSSLIRRYSWNICYAFFDPSFFNRHLSYLLRPFLLVLVCYSIYFVCRKAPRRVWVFLFTLMGVTASALILLDLILGRRLSTVNRYVIPCYLGIQISVAYLLAVQITSITASVRQRRLWQLITASVVSLGVLSCAFISQAEFSSIIGSTKNKHNYPVAHIINQANNPLLISSNYPRNLPHLLSLSYLLEPKVRFLLVPEPNTPDIPDGFGDIFLFNAPEAQEWPLEARLKEEQKYRIEPIYEKVLWQLEK